MRCSSSAGSPPPGGWTALAGLGCYGFAPAGLLLDVPAAVLVAGYVLADVDIEVFNVPWFTATQREMRPELLARTCRTRRLPCQAW